MKKKICILFAVLWMGFIFYMSHQPAKISSAQSDNVMHVIKKVSKSEEIKNNDPLNLPDGIFFRRKSVSVYSPHMKEIHRGISGETEITLFRRCICAEHILYYACAGGGYGSVWEWGAACMH